jgi:hypothetical protein
MRASARICAVLLLLTSACEADGLTTVEEVRRELVEGMSAEDVERFLARHRIEHSVLRGDALRDEADLRAPEAREGLRSRYVAILRDVGVRAWIYSESIQIKVDVDEHGRARRVQVYEVYTGP